MLRAVRGESAGDLAEGSGREWPAVRRWAPGGAAPAAAFPAVPSAPSGPPVPHQGGASLISPLTQSCAPDYGLDLLHRRLPSQTAIR